MGSIRPCAPVKLFAGVLVSSRNLIPAVERALTGAWGKIDHRSGIIPFDFTDYYEKEMGDVLDRILFSFETLISPSDLSVIKIQSNTIEQALSELLPSVTRPVNVDPGYIEPSKVVLASTKNFYHRICVGQGIFAEVTMHFRNNTFQFFPWTYPDYQSRDYQDFFIRMRQILRGQMKVTEGDPGK